MRLGHWVPIVEWLPRYDRRDLRADVIAGTTTAVMLIPQAMGYAMLAGLPPIAGLYASLAPLLAYALFGTSRQLAVGPVAMDSLLVAVSVSAIAATGSDQYVALAIMLALMVGGLQASMGLLRLGFVVNFLSRPVITGFTAAAALIIGFSQLRHVLGIGLPTTHHVHRVLWQALEQASSWNLPTVAIGASAVVALVVLKRAAPKLPRALLVVAVATAAVWALVLEGAGVAVVGEVPPGLPAVSLPHVDTSLLATLLPAALTISLVSFMEAISVGTHFARQGHYEVRPNQELIALGAANASASLVGGYPIAGGFSRTAVNASAGARTQLSAIVTAVLVALTLVVLTPAFTDMPTAALAAIIITAVFGLIDVAEAKRLWRTKREDFAMLVVAFAATLSVGIQWGVVIGVGASVAWFVVQTTRPHFAVLGRVPGTEAYLNVARHPHARTYPGVLVVRIDAQFYFGNMTFLRDTLRDLEARMADPLRAVILDMSGVNQLDSSAEATLDEMDREYAARDVRLMFSRVKGPVRDVMFRSGLLQRLDQEHRIHFRTHDSVQIAIGAPVDQPVLPMPDRRAPSDRLGCDAPRSGNASVPPEADTAADPTDSADSAETRSVAS